MFFGWGKGASDDLKEYRDGYPRQKINKNSNSNYLFFAGKGKMQPENIFIEDLLKWKGHHRQLEWSHTYIQWLFPIREQGLNWQADPLQPHEIELMKNDPVIIDRVIRGFEMMLDFYGFTLDRVTGKIQRATVDKNQFQNLNTSGHNYLRITRMCKFLGEMGLESYKVNWLDAFYHEIYETKALSPCQSSYDRYWIGAIYDDELREAFAKRIKTGEPVTVAFPAPPPIATAGGDEATKCSTSASVAVDEDGVEQRVVAENPRPAKTAEDQGEEEEEGEDAQPPKDEQGDALD